MLPLVLGDRDVADELVLSGERLLVANRTSAVVGGRRVAEVLTLRDRTELFGAMRELDGMAEVDVIVIARGGGSFEDLLAFSDESLIRAVAAARLAS